MAGRFLKGREGGEAGWDKRWACRAFVWMLGEVARQHMLSQSPQPRSRVRSAFSPPPFGPDVGGNGGVGGADRCRAARPTCLILDFLIGSYHTHSRRAVRPRRAIGMITYAPPLVRKYAQSVQLPDLAQKQDRDHNVPFATLSPRSHFVSMNELALPLAIYPGGWDDLAISMACNGCWYGTCTSVPCAMRVGRKGWVDCQQSRPQRGERGEPVQI